MLRDHGTFSLYTPVLPDGHPYVAARALFVKNDAAVDWYSIAHAPPIAGRTFAMMRDGRVVAVDTDPSRLWPIDAQVVETDGPVEIGWSLSGDSLRPYVPPRADARLWRWAWSLLSRFFTAA